MFYYSLISFYILSTFLYCAELKIELIPTSPPTKIEYNDTTSSGKSIHTIQVRLLKTNNNHIIYTNLPDYGSTILKIIKNAHSPKIFKKKNLIIITYISGVNTKAQAVYEITNGAPIFISTETISWNKSGNLITNPNITK